MEIYKKSNLGFNGSVENPVPEIKRYEELDEWIIILNMQCEEFNAAFKNVKSLTDPEVDSKEVMEKITRLKNNIQSLREAINTFADLNGIDLKRYFKYAKDLNAPRAKKYLVGEETPLSIER